MKHVQHEKLHTITLLFRELSYNKTEEWKWCFARSAIFCKQSKRLLHDGCRYCGDAETFHASVCLFCVPSGEISFCLQVAHSYYIKVPAWRVAIIHAEASQASGIEETRAVEVGSRPSTAAWIMKEGCAQNKRQGISGSHIWTAWNKERNAVIWVLSDIFIWMHTGFPVMLHEIMYIYIKHC